MAHLSPHDITIVFLSLGVLLVSARLLGELFHRLSQPPVVGELLAGVLLGPTLMGRVWPQFTQTLFPAEGPRSAVLDSLSAIAIALFLLVAGLEVQLSTIWRRGRTSLAVALAGFAVPFALALAAAWMFPYSLGCERDAHPRVFALFFATALSISALPHITRTVIDLHLFRSDLGTIAIAAALFNDLVGWMVFAVIVGILGGGTNPALDVTATILLTLLSATLMLTVGRWLLHRVLPLVQAHTSWPGGIIGFAVSLALLAAALTEWIGIHAVFGAFLLGVAMGDSPHLRAQTRRTILDFVSFIFAPLFFASLGLRIDFAAKFDLPIVLTVLVIACAGKLLGCSLAARLTGMEWNTSWALGFAMNSRGSMAIILGLLALQNGLIRQRMFEALVIMAAVTMLISAPAIRWVLGRRRLPRFTAFLAKNGFHRSLRPANRWQAMEVLAASVLPPEEADSTLWGGDVRVEWAGPNQEVAVCLVGLPSVSVPHVAVGLAPKGIDFGPLAETLARIVVFVATPMRKPDLEAAIEEDIVASLASERAVGEARAAANWTEFLAAVRTSEDAQAARTSEVEV
ncbi:MAG TPA: cation:proton antiporter [Pirellulaceae bacterium]|nr:cation:proton antiporter [Pirellulaceae bacterium]